VVVLPIASTEPVKDVVEKVAVEVIYASIMYISFVVTNVTARLFAFIKNVKNDAKNVKFYFYANTTTKSPIVKYAKKRELVSIIEPAINVVFATHLIYIANTVLQNIYVKIVTVPHFANMINISLDVFTAEVPKCVNPVFAKRWE
jgi:hypothetical protein